MKKEGHKPKKKRYRDGVYTEIYKGISKSRAMNYSQALRKVGDKAHIQKGKKGYSVFWRE